MADYSKREVKHVADIVGEFGKWQLQMCCFCFVLYAMEAVNNLGYAFHAFNNEFFCSDVPINYPNKTSAMKCHKFERPNETCHSWHFDRTQFNRSIVTEFQLVCERKDFAAFTQTSYMLSYVVSGLVVAHLQDRYGRRPMVWTSMTVELVGLIGCVVSGNMYHYMISRFFVGLGGSGRGGVAVIITESSGPKYRSELTIISQMGWIAGYALLPAYAYWLRDYQKMQIGSIGLILLLFAWFCFMHESPRWQIVAGKVDRAEVTLRKALKTNGKTDQHLKQELFDLSDYLLKSKNETESKQRLTALDLFRSRRLRRYTLIFWYLGVMNAFIYYGFSLNISDFGGNHYIAFFLSGLVELPSALLVIYFLRTRGRRLSFVIFILVIITALFAIIFSSSSTQMLVFALLVKFGVTSSWSVFDMHQAEILPTSLRRTGSGTISLVSRIGAITAPFMKNLAAVTGLVLVLAIYAVFAIIGAILYLQLPETKGLEIPDTIEETEKLGSNKAVSSGKVNQII